uniref:Uncharacterized protein n=1 Tax=Meloidogyne hapla TaxID=6305 RepID=A0A1I8BWR3_MELHA
MLIYIFLIFNFISIVISTYGYGGKYWPKAQIYPLAKVNNEVDDYWDEFEEKENFDEYGFGKLFEDEYGREEKIEDPKAKFWIEAIGPFLYTFDNKRTERNGRNNLNIWSKVLEKINLLRRQNLGNSFRELSWDDQLAKRLSTKEYSQMKPLAVPITNPSDGILANLQFGMESLFQAVIRRYIQCEKTTQNCYVIQNSKYRIPIEKINLSERERNSRNKDILLFKISQIQNSRFKRKLISEAKNTENNDRYGYESIEDEWNKKKNNDWNEERQWGDDVDKNERDMEEDMDDDDFNERNGRNEKNERNRPSRDIDLKIKAERGDILEAKVDVIVNPTRPSLSIG